MGDAFLTKAFNVQPASVKPAGCLRFYWGHPVLPVSGQMSGVLSYWCLSSSSRLVSKDLDICRLCILRSLSKGHSINHHFFLLWSSESVAWRWLRCWVAKWSSKVEKGRKQRERGADGLGRGVGGLNNLGSPGPDPFELPKSGWPTWGTHWVRTWVGKGLSLYWLPTGLI